MALLQYSLTVEEEHHSISTGSDIPAISPHFYILYSSVCLSGQNVTAQKHAKSLHYHCISSSVGRELGFTVY